MIYDFPVQKAHPYKFVPDWCEVRRGRNEEGKKIVIINTIKEKCGHEFHVVWRWRGPKTGDDAVICLNNLGAAIFEAEHPGMWIKLVRAEAKIYTEGGNLSPGMKALRKRLDELTFKKETSH